jgi:hypothetical protein
MIDKLTKEVREIRNGHLCIQSGSWPPEIIDKINELIDEINNIKKCVVANSFIQMPRLTVTRNELKELYPDRPRETEKPQILESSWDNFGATEGLTFGQAMIRLQNNYAVAREGAKADYHKNDARTFREKAFSLEDVFAKDWMVV